MLDLLNDKLGQEFHISDSSVKMMIKSQNMQFEVNIAKQLLIVKMTVRYKKHLNSLNSK